MSFRTTDPLARALLSAQSTAAALKTYVAGVRAACAAGSVSANLLVELHLRLIADKASLQANAAVSGIAAYAQAQYSDPAYDVAAEFTSMVNAITGVINWIVANFPASGGYIQKDQISAAGITVRSFTSAQTAGLVTQLDSLTSAIG